MMLIDKIVDRAKHWSMRMLSYAGRLQLLKSISFAITNYWLQCIPLPKFVIKKINSICHTFCGQVVRRLVKKAQLHGVMFVNQLKMGV